MKIGLHGTLTGLLGLGMTLGAVSPAFAAQPVKDINGHWAEKQLQEWVNQGTLKGFEDGTVRPNQSITRAEFIALVNRIFGYTESAQVQFNDLSSSNWAYTDVAKAVKAGYVQGYQDQTIHPSADVTRQEAAAMIGKVVGLTAGQTDSLSTLKDADRISAWSKQGVAAVLESKIMNGYPNQTFEPQKSLTRAEAVVLIDAAFAKKTSEVVTFDQAGTYGGKDQEIQVIHGNVVISAPGVTLQNVEIQGNLTLAEGIGSGDATLKNVKVHGTTNVEGGGENSIHFVDSVLVNIVVNKKDGTVRIVAEGSTVTQSVVVKSSAKLEEDHASGEGFTNVELSKELPANAKVTLNGTFDDVEVFAASISVQLVKGSIENVQVDGSAGNTSIELSSEAKIVKLVLDAVAKLLGSGQIQTATINDGAKGSTFQTKPNQTEGSQKDSIQVNTPASSGSSGGSSNGGSSGGSSGGSNGGGNNGGGTTNPVDTVAPVITLKGEATVTLAYGADYVDAGVTIADNKDTGLKAKVTYSKDGKVVDKIDTEVAGTYTIHYNVSDAAGNKAKEVTRTVVVEAPVQKPVIQDAALSVDSKGLLLNFSIDKAIDLKTKADVKISYFTKDAEGNLVPIHNKISDSDLVKNKLWDGYLWDVETHKNYSSGAISNPVYSDQIAAGTKLATLVNQGLHGVGGDMDYVDINWNDPATYVVQIVVMDNEGRVSETVEKEVTVEAPEQKPLIQDAALSVDSNGLLLNFSIDKAIDLKTKADVQISYFTKDAEGNLVPIHNTISESDLVKNKLWDGYLWDVETHKNYSSGAISNPVYSDQIAAGAKLATLVNQGLHGVDGDMDYVDINWNDPATYVVQIVVSDNEGRVSETVEKEVTVEAPEQKPVIQDAALSVDSNGLLLNFSIDKAIDLKTKADVRISYFTKDADGTLTAIRNTKINTDLVKNKLWDGYLWDVETHKNYSSGALGNPAYSDQIAAGTKLATLVNQGLHGVDGDMDYVDINWSDPATYVVQIVVTDNEGRVSEMVEKEVTVEAPVQKPVIQDAALSVDSNGLLLNFSIDKAIDLKTKADVKIIYFTKDAEGNLVPIHNTISDSDLVKNKLWDGYLWDVETHKNYSSGELGNADYSDQIAAGTKLATLVNQGLHGVGGDMDYVDINWNDPATYVVQIVVTDNEGRVSETVEKEVTVVPTTET
ncbi:S-layer homology domain-containing protein [Paenibacillus sp. VMFN-D1]|uniref:S-layer homology domain-containing protein n=1 Tax=Paenibacillus sp. VMFN-D1 TaxID=2135608 RepID=UPI000E25E934|nr:S-layer homology domain-containing protein [Paenibacillus sp. VMFN-D1]RED33791.1 S-layer family protein [Paenibacillus sp. VMFN-D1]